MRRFTLLTVGIAVVLSVTGCNAKKTWLLGTWQSDKKATEDYLTSELKTSPQVIAILDKVLGKMIITYTPTNVIFSNCELSGTYGYAIVGTNGNDIQIQNVGANGEKSTISTIRFTNRSGFWSIPSKSHIKGFQEKFKRIENQQDP